MINPGDLRKGLTVDLDDQLWTVLDYEHNKTGRGGALVRIKLRNLRSGATIERTFSANEKFKRVYLDKRKAQYLYADDDTHFFMDQETFEQFSIGGGMLGEDVSYLKDQLVVDVLTHEGQAIGVELPLNVELEVIETEPGYRGDTANAGTKPATLETGLKVSVPLFIKVGDTIRIDTRTGEYLTRV
ncbi:MAG: elongation factor P [Chloroflexi bacterium]|nr:elongation factor P [Chloroflexota bacterium]